MKIFLDDSRSFENIIKKGYTCVRTYDECIGLLKNYQYIEVIDLDYELESEETGLDVLKYMKENMIISKEIIIHSTHAGGVREMIDYIEEHFDGVKYRYCPLKNE